MNTKMNIQKYNSRLLVDLGIVAQNARTILAGLQPGTELIPVLKDNAYGLGLIPVARTICEIPAIRTLAVAHVSEGLALRESGIDRDILVMGGALPSQAEAAVAADLTPACARPGFLRELRAAAERCGRTAKAQVKIDTGLHRIGLEPEELDAFLEEYRECADSVALTGIFSHFSDVADAALNEKEYGLFLAAVEKLEAAGLSFPLRHIACSASSERWPQYNLDAVRCGRRLYMDRPDAPMGEIREAVSLRASITQVKKRPAGTSVGYGGAGKLARESLIATVGAGYGDGLNQGLFRIHAPVLAGGKLCSLLACCMDQCMIDVTGTDCRVGDEVTFFGCDEYGNFLSSQKIAALVNTDEGCGLTSALSERVERAYI